MPPKKTSAGPGESAQNRRSSQKTDSSGNALKRSDSRNKGHKSSLEHSRSLNESLKTSDESPASNGELKASNELQSSKKRTEVQLSRSHEPKETPDTINAPRSSKKKPVTSSQPSPSPKKNAHPSRKTSVASGSPSASSQRPKPRQNVGMTETAASVEPPVFKRLVGEKRFKTAALFYLIFALGLLAINFWNPVGAVLSPSSGLAGTVDLTGRQSEFEAEWRRKLQELDLSGETLSQTSTSRLREERLGVFRPNGFGPGNGPGLVKWIRSEVKAVLPEAENEARLVETGGAWKKICESMGFVVSKTTWGYTNQTLWVVLDSEADIEPGGRRLSLPMQKITLIQPLRGGHRKTLNWRGLVPENPPALVAPVPKPVQKPVSTTAPTPKPPLSSKPVPVVKPKPTAVPLRSPGPIPSAVPKQSLVPPTAKPPQIKIRAKVAIIIDDVGATHDEATEAFLQVPARLTWSVMPLMPYGDRYMAAGKEHGFEIMLHLPLEPLDAKINPGPGVIKASWPEEEIRQKFDEDLQSVPASVGINNHMGSAGTSDDRLMNILLQAVKEKGLYFVDSMTYKTSVAGTYARQYRVPFGKRDVFIDNQSTVESKKKQLRELINKALKNGSAIGIGHVRPGTAEAILEMLPEFVKAGVAIVPVSELVR